MEGTTGHASTVGLRLVALAAVSAAAVSLLVAGPAVLHAASGTVLVRSAPAAFDPARLTVVVGDTVTWTVAPGNVHTITSGTYNASGVHPDGRFDSGSLSPEETFAYTFTEPGDYPYVCTIHADSGMVGRITVIEDVAAESPPVTSDPAQSPAPTSAPPSPGGSDGGSSAARAGLVIAIALAFVTAILVGRRARLRSRT